MRCWFSMSIISLSGVDFYSILPSSPVPPTIPGHLVTPKGVIALEQPMHKKVSACAVERDESTKFKKPIFHFSSGHAWVLHLGLLEADLLCNPCCWWPSSWKISIDIGNMAVRKSLTVTPLAICDAAVLISLPLISFSFSVSGHRSSAMSRAVEF